eukprot:403375398
MKNYRQFLPLASFLMMFLTSNNQVKGQNTESSLILDYTAGNTTNQPTNPFNSLNIKDIVVRQTVTQGIVFDQSMESCKLFANSFANTCDMTTDPNAQPPSSLSQVPVNQKTCSNVSESIQQVILNRRLCVTCSLIEIDSVPQVFVRVQSNGLPNHCVYWGGDSNDPDATGTSAAIDFQVKWNALTPRIPLSYNIETQAQLDHVICEDNEWSRIIPDDRQFSNIQETMRPGTSTDLSEFVGIALNGVLISNGLKGIEYPTDPLYPIKYGSFDKPMEAYETFDECLTSIQDSNSLGIHHYHILSPCLISSAWQAKQAISSCADSQTCLQSYKYYAKSDWSPKRLMPIGLAKDGHPIYGPFNDRGSLWQPCEVDVCNGLFINNQYAYVSTMFHPYFIGCWGPTNKPTLQQSCSANPRQCSQSHNSLSPFGIIEIIAFAMVYYISNNFSDSCQNSKFVKKINI